MTFPKLKHPPIKEAIISIVFDKNTPLTEKELNSLDKLFIGEKYNKTDLKQSYIEVDISKDGEENTNITKKNIGTIYRSQDNEWGVRLTETEIAISKYEPYTTCDDIKNKIRDIWKNTIGKDHLIQQINIQTINMFGIVQENFNNHINFPVFPKLGEKIEKEAGVKNTLLKYELKLSEEISCNLIFVASAPNDKDVEIIFDIDTYSTAKNITNLETIFSQIDLLREYKNSIFYANINNAKELFNDI